MDSFISTFHIDWKILIAQAINFGLVFLLIYFFALKPIKKIMGERTKTIEDGLTDATQNALLLKNTKEEYNQVIMKAREEAHVIFQDGKREAEEKKNEMLAIASKDVETLIANGKKVLEAEKAKMVEEAKNEIVSLVVKATEKLLETEANQSFDKKAIEQIKKI